MDKTDLDNYHHRLLNTLSKPDYRANRKAELTQAVNLAGPNSHSDCLNHSDQSLEANIGTENGFLMKASASNRTPVLKINQTITTYKAIFESGWHNLRNHQETVH
jgi:hypothetical protein